MIFCHIDRVKMKKGNEKYSFMIYYPIIRPRVGLR